MTEKEKIAIIYHSLFNFTLSEVDLERWRAGTKLELKKGRPLNNLKKHDIKSNPALAISSKKLQIAKRAAVVLARIPTVLFVGVTGSLAMNNAKPESDVDLMIITKSDSLWSTRLIALPILYFSGFKMRRAKQKEERDKLCLNLWLDETVLVWTGPQNAYIAHEIAQVVPLVNKAHIYESWIESNGWIKAYWPNAVVMRRRKMFRKKSEENVTLASVMWLIFNQFCFFAQRAYMGRKVTRETVTLKKAFFHPYDWGEKIMRQLSLKGVKEV